MPRQVGVAFVAFNDADYSLGTQLVCRFHVLRMGAFNLSIDGARCDVMRKKGRLMGRLFAKSVFSTTADPVMVLGGPCPCNDVLTRESLPDRADPRIEARRLVLPPNRPASLPFAL
jgi:hypothetical protein